MAHLHIYKASAGAGKTYTLAAEYIKLLMRQTDNYRRILAVTFTNKATAEMKGRILEKLYSLAHGLPDADDYLATIAKECALEPESIRLRAAEALTLMLHDYDNFRVTTIDSFFQLIIVNLARELGIGSRLNIDLDSGNALSAAVDEMIDALTADAPEMKWIQSVVDERYADGNDLDITGDIKAFAAKSFDEPYTAGGGQLRAALEADPQLPVRYRNKLRQMVANDKADIDRQAKAARARLTAWGVTSKTAFKYLDHLEAGRLTDKRTTPSYTVYTDRLDNALNNPGSLVKKDPQADAQATALLRDLEQLRRKAVITIHSTNLSTANLHSLQLLSSINRTLTETNERDGRFLLSATNALLAAVIADSDTSFVFERIGAQIEHLMIDEFQDTSELQFRNFRVMLKEGLSQDRDSLVVGDVKQSVYRWRNGNWRVLASLGHEGTDIPVLQHPLNTNYRSEDRVIRFNNRLFPAAADCLDRSYRALFDNGCTDIKAAYADVEQKVPQRREPGRGYVRIESVMFPKGYPGDHHKATLVRTLAALRHLTRDCGVRPADICMLFRKNDEIADTASYLAKEAPDLPVVSADAFTLDSSATVCAAVAAMRLIANPADDIARRLTADTGRTVDLAPLAPLPVADMAARLLAAYRVEGEDAYEMAFLDAVAAFLNRQRPDLRLLLREWDKTIHKLTIPAPATDGIRLLTVHKAKGLQAHTVIVPFCDWELTCTKKIQAVWCRPQQEPYCRIPLQSIRYCPDMGQSVFSPDYEHETLEQWIESLNTLYVAFTRAEKNLIVVAPCKSSDGQWPAQTADIGRLVDAALRPARPDGANPLSDISADWEALLDDKTLDTVGQPIALLYEEGRIVASAPADEAEDGTAKANPLAAKPKTAPVVMGGGAAHPAFRQSGEAALFTADDEDAGAAPRWRMISRGLLLHSIFERIETRDDAAAVLGSLEASGLVAGKEEAEATAHFVMEAIDSPGARDWYSGRYRVMAEREILTPGGAKYRPDRVMTDGSRTIVVDYKFGARRPDHLHQVENYKRLLETMGHTGVTACVWYVGKEIVTAEN